VREKWRAERDNGNAMDEKTRIQQLEDALIMVDVDEIPGV
jgi:hypothetical protein